MRLEQIAFLFGELQDSHTMERHPVWGASLAELPVILWVTKPAQTIGNGIIH
jgi:hypothetical protein